MRTAIYEVRDNPSAPGKRFEVWNVRHNYRIAVFRMLKDAEREVAYLAQIDQERRNRPQLNPYIEPDDLCNLAIISAAKPDPEPEPPTPAAPAYKPTRFPIATARHYSVCAISGKPIRPNDLITNYRGEWCLYDQAVADDDRRRREGVQRRTDQAFADQFLVFVVDDPAVLQVAR